MYCIKCGAEIPDESEFCSKCGNPTSPNAAQNNRYAGVPPPYAYQYQYQYQRPMKSVGLAAILSFLFTGIRQVYVGRIARGIGFIVCGVVIFSVLTLMMFIFGGIASSAIGVLFIAASIISVVIWIFNIFDAYSLANEYNDVLQQTGNPPW